ncbi:MAG TPA: hypothetical protein VFK30_06185, partial [Anaerolineae bacterium]|nr:hypothetical protein [Anaerolineae bacterium]
GGVPNIGAAENHSDLIEMFQTGSDPDLVTAWLTQYYVVGSWHRATASYPTWHGDYLYLFVTGIYWVDDLTA